MPERKRRSSSTMKLQMNILDGRDSPYVNKELTDWLFAQRNEIEKRVMEMTIMEYKKAIKNQRPDWVKKFTERNISAADILKEPGKYFQHVLGKGQNKWYLERELIEIDSTTKFVVERILNKRRHCKQLAIIIPEENGKYRYRQEEWVSSGKWRVAKQFPFKAVDGFYTDGEFFKSTKPMGELFEKKMQEVHVLSR
jgi:hypothetical protein